MIVDVHSHAWRHPDHFSDEFCEQAARARGGTDIDLTVNYDEYRKTAPDDTKTIVFGGKARLGGMWVEDGFIADYVAQDPEHLTGFLSLDPAQEGWQGEMHYGHLDLNLKGIKLLPMYAGFKPNDQRLLPLWDYAQEHHLPVILHSGTTFISQAPLDCTCPRYIDEVAIDFPDVIIVMGHMGHPFENEAVCVARKHRNVYMDISALYYRPWQFYNSLMLVQEYGIWGKLFFGSDYPFTTVNESIAGIRGLNDMLEGTALPRLDVDEIEAVFNRDTLSILGIG